MAVDVTTRPQLLNANNLVYDFWDLRRMHEGQPAGPGVANRESFRVQPRQAGANLSVDIGVTGVGLMEAWVRGSSRGGQGLYRVDNVEPTAPTVDTYKAQLNCAVTSNATGNPRLDQVVLVIGDAQHAGALNKAYIDVIAGTATGGATLDNRTGAAALPASCLLLADILLASGDATVDAADIQDRRVLPLYGSVPPLLTAVDQVQFVPPPGVAITRGLCASNPSFDSYQSAVLMYLPRRIAGATRLRWKYVQGATANAGNYNISIFDSSGRLIIGTGTIAYAGIAGTYQVRSETITATTFEAGYYYVFMGNSPATGSSTVRTLGCGIGVGADAETLIQLGPIAPNLGMIRNTGGITVPSRLSTVMSDMNAQATAVVLPTVPVVTLSVG